MTKLATTKMVNLDSFNLKRFLDVEMFIFIVIIQADIEYPVEDIMVALSILG